MKKKDLEKPWRNIFPAIPIPLNKDYSLNERELREYVRWLAKIDGIEGIVCNGHTGEITSLNRTEKRRVTEIIVEEVGNRVLVVSGIAGDEGTLDAIDRAKEMQEVGADGILLMPPHVWLRFGMKRESPVKYFQDVGRGIDMGIIIHQYPYDCKAFYPVEMVLEMAKIPNVKALKCGIRQMAVYERDVGILRKKAPRLTILSCMDEYLVSTLYIGVDGALVGFAGLVPELITEAWKAVQVHDFAKTRKLQSKIFPLTQAVYQIGQPSGEAHARLKEALRQRGIFSSSLMRPPVMPISDQEKRAITLALREAKLK
ncbi:MAG: dihydrodipicolinate synthase family protein [Deltaproteobacteria bacterium RBG_16_48_10]|nr:MAG: dihydrodipicolinate synthase family protein [Deltaproteobacteria bacterium RBG_16_48_10]